MKRTSSALGVLPMLLCVALSACSQDVATFTSESCPIGPDEPKFYAIDATNDSPTVWPSGGLEVSVQRDVIYAQGLSHKQWNGTETQAMDLKLDVYKPANVTSTRPAVLLIHGGGFSIGSKEGMANYAQYFAERGFVAFAMNYRLGAAKGTLPRIWNDSFFFTEFINSIEAILRGSYVAARDGKAALRWIHSNSQYYDIDPERISVIGDSAGAQIAVALGISDQHDYTEEIAIEHDRSLSTTNLGASTEVASMVSLWGSGFIHDLSHLFWGKQRWKTNDTPALYVHGTLDTVVPYFEGFRAAVNQCRSSAGFIFHTLTSGKHGAWDALIEGKPLVEEVFRFVSDSQNLYQENSL